jgi:nitrogen regulatory protein PII-like uncharacterized protein
MVMTDSTYIEGNSREELNKKLQTKLQDERWIIINIYETEGVSKTSKCIAWLGR